jgi:transcriptional regulator with XRE-family HTH domain
MHSPASLSILTRFALRTLGEMIKCARLGKRMSQSNLAQRLNRSRYTVMALEKGDPNVSIGIVFEAATIVGVRLLEEDKTSMQKLSNIVSSLTSVLPKKAKAKTEKINDDF